MGFFVLWPHSGAGYNAAHNYNIPSTKQKKLNADALYDLFDFEVYAPRFPPGFLFCGGFYANTQQTKLQLASLQHNSTIRAIFTKNI